MISDKKLGRISLLITIIGIIMIYVATLFLSPLITEIGNITDHDVGKTVVVNGTIASYSVNNGNIFIKLSDSTGNITVVMFERTARDQPRLNNSAIVIVEGQVNVYKSELEIIATSIEAI